MSEVIATEADNAAPPPSELDAAALIELYIDLRAAKRATEKRHEQELSLFIQRMEKIEQVLHRYMLAHKLNSLPTDSGTAYTNVKRSASVADGTAFRSHIIENRDWDLADWRANVNSCEAHIKEHGVPPPGVNYREFETVGVRRPTKEKD
jgi:hypothetical protein